MILERVADESVPARRARRRRWRDDLHVRSCSAAKRMLVVETSVSDGNDEMKMPPPPPPPPPITLAQKKKKKKSANGLKLFTKPVIV